MSVDNPIIVTTYLPTIDEAKEILLSNIDKSENEIELNKKWYFICYDYIKFTFIADAGVKTSDYIYSKVIEPIEGSNKVWITGKIRYRQ